MLYEVITIMLTLLSGAMKSAFFGFLALYAIYFLEVHAALFESFSRLLSLIVALGMMTLLWRLKRDRITSYNVCYTKLLRKQISWRLKAVSA